MFILSRMGPPHQNYYVIVPKMRRSASTGCLDRCGDNPAPAIILMANFAHFQAGLTSAGIPFDRQLQQIRGPPW